MPDNRSNNRRDRAGGKQLGNKLSGPAIWTGGALLLGVAAMLTSPKLASKARLTARRATGITYRSGVSRPGVRTAVDPARGIAG